MNNLQKIRILQTCAKLALLSKLISIFRKCFASARHKDSSRVNTQLLLVCFTSEDPKLTVLSDTPCLCFHDSYKKLFIAPNVTKFERAKCRKLFDELRQQGDTNMIIKNGTKTTKKIQHN